MGRMGPMTPAQRELARHALGLPNKKHTTNRNYYCIGKGGDGYTDWEDLVSKGLAIKRRVPHFGGDDLFYLTLEGARLARDPKEHLSREDAEWARKAAEEAKR